MNEQEADDITSRLAELGRELIREQWNGSMLSINATEKAFEEVVPALQNIFGDHAFECDVESAPPPTLKIYAEGPRTTSTKRYRWEVNLFHVDDEQSVEDCSSYIAKDLSTFTSAADQFLIVIFENSDKYDL